MKTVSTRKKFSRAVRIAVYGAVVLLVFIAVLRRPGFDHTGPHPVHWTKVTARLLINACMDFRLDMEKFPESLDELVNSNGSVEWHGPYLDAPTIPRDAWGRPYVYVPPAGEGQWWGLISLGADGKPNGTKENADLWYPEALTRTGQP